MKNAQTVCITMPREFVSKAQKLAARESRTMSELVREALRRYMAENARSETTVERRATADTPASERASEVIHSFRMARPPEE